MNIYLKLFFLKRWHLCCLLFCVTACHSLKEERAFSVSQTDSLSEEINAATALKKIYKTKDFVQSADIILRTGKDYTSQLMRNLSTHDKTYSHSGIASWENDTLFVYHSIGGEGNPTQKLRRDRFEMFCNPYANRGFGVYRYRVSEKQKEKIVSKAKEYYSHHLLFDMKFDLNSDDKMYCSEFIYKTIKAATDDAINLKTTTLNHIKFVAIDDLFFNPFCYEIKRVSFAKQ